MKTNKQYAIKLTHPEFGVYYFEKSAERSSYYSRGQVHYFTKKLEKVQKFKNVTVLNRKLAKLNNKQKIYLRFNDMLNDTGKQRLEFSETTKLKKITDVEIERLKLEELKEELILNSTQTLKLLENFEGNYTKVVKNLEKSNSISKNLKRSLRIVKNPIQIEIVDASFNFRTLKMKTLQNIAHEER